MENIKYNLGGKIVTVNGINYKLVVTHTSNCDGCFFNIYKDLCWKINCSIDNIEYILTPEET